jgi:hypothetical protein
MKIFLAILLLSAPLAGAADGDDWRALWDSDKAAIWYAKSDAELLRLAEGGSGSAMMIISGRLQETHKAESQKWFMAALKAGQPQALEFKGLDWLQTDPKAALVLFEKAAATGYPRPKAWIGQIHLEGLGVPVDPAKAVEFYRAGVDGGAIQAIYDLAVLYASGVGDPRSEKETPAALFRKAAKVGRTAAMDELAYRYRRGFGVEKDLLEAAGWAACSRFHTLKKTGGDVAPDSDYFGTPDEVELTMRRLGSLFDEACLKGVRAAQLELAELHLKNADTKPNLPRAAALFTLAGSEKAGEITAKLSEAERKEMQEDLQWMRF